MFRRFKPILLRVYRLGVLVLIAWLLHRQHVWMSAQKQAPLGIEEVKKFLPDAASLGEVQPENGLQRVLDKDGETEGFIAETSPLSDDIIGYAGPTNSLIVFDVKARVVGVKLLHSEDTPEHVKKVRLSTSFFKSFRMQRLGDMTEPPKVDAVSGATLTSAAITEGVLRRLGQHAPSLRFPKEITIKEVRALVPDARTLEPIPQKHGLLAVKNNKGKVIAQAGRTAPEADSIIGYRGPSDCLFILSADGLKLQALDLRKSFDTPEYVGYVTGDKFYLKSFNGMTVEKLAGLDFDKAGVEGVSGATQTSYAVAQGLKKRAQSLIIPPKKKASALEFAFKTADWGLVAVIVISLLMTFSPLRGKAWARWMHHALLIGYAGFYCGAFLSQGLLVGWAKNGLPWQSAPHLVLLAALALTVPLFFRRQFYCHHYCPHGALQQLIARRLPWQIQVPAFVGRWLEKVPSTLLLAVLVVGILGLKVDVNGLEAFDAWLIRVAGTSAMVIAVAGLVASLFIPMAYCRYGCPTGALLKFVRYSGEADTFGKKDALALGFVLIAILLPMLRSH